MKGDRESQSPFGSPVLSLGGEITYAMAAEVPAQCCIEATRAGLSLSPLSHQLRIQQHSQVQLSL